MADGNGGLDELSTENDRLLRRIADLEHRCGLESFTASFPPSADEPKQPGEAAETSAEPKGAVQERSA